MTADPCGEGQANVFDFDSVIDRGGTHSLKWQAYAGQDVLPMWVADMDFASPPAVVEALRARVDHGVFGYTVAPEPLNALMVERCRQRYGWSIEPHWLVWLPGVVPGLSLACRAFTRPGEAVATFTPVYPPFLDVPGEAQRAICRIPLDRVDGHAEIDPERFAAQLSAETRLLLLCHPHNPVGRVFSVETLQSVARICRERGIRICSDEIYADLILDDTAHHPFATIAPDMAEQTVTLLSPGKTFNITGLNIGLAIIPDPGMRRDFAALARHLVPHPNALAYTATDAAYRHGEPWRQALLAVLRRNAALVHNFVGSHPDLLRMDPVQATYLAWIDASAIAGENPVARFRNAGVGLSPGAPFGADGFVRLNFGCPLPTLARALDRLDAALHVNWEALDLPVEHVPTAALYPRLPDGAQPTLLPAPPSTPAGTRHYETVLDARNETETLELGMALPTTSGWQLSGNAHFAVAHANDTATFEILDADGKPLARWIAYRGEARPGVTRPRGHTNYLVLNQREIEEDFAVWNSQTLPFTLYFTSGNVRLELPGETVVERPLLDGDATRPTLLRATARADRNTARVRIERITLTEANGL